ncbi:hypothetical protein ACG83_04695 [Frankia sp. R43]|uniref:recombinase family protein n=1 Tax=Frankia sp. R43 TaxID=269536 RepID=UPI0006C9F506|nr:hypothetical protein ACG83_39700 [Frankia sp. R43]KPM57085.1 hypothetical protein ACG83_04695 [Frankia sp. R43]
MSDLDKDARIPDQFARGQKYAAVTGEYWIAGAWADDGISAWREDVVRPEFERFLSVLRAGKYQLVVAWEESRITRDPVVGAEFGKIMQRVGGRLIVTDGEKATTYDFRRQRDRDSWHGAVGKSVSDSGLKSELIKRKLDAKREALEFMGGPVGFGWSQTITRKGKKIVTVWSVDEEQARWLREAAQRIREGEAVLKVSDDFYDRGLRIPHRRTRPDDTMEAGSLTRASLSAMLRNPRIAGLFATGNVHTGWTVVGPMVNFPAILTEEEWRETCAALEAVTTRKGTGTAVKHTFAGYYVCHKCRRSLVRNSPRAYALWRHRLGKSREHFECDQSFHINAADADDLMTRLVDEYLRRRVWEKTGDVADGDELKAERTEKERELADLPRAIAAKEISLRLGGQLEAQYETRLREIDAELARRARLVTVLDGAEALRLWRGGTLTEKRRVLSTIIVKIVVIPGKELPLRERLDPQWRYPGPA